VTGPASLWPTRGRSVQSSMAVSNGPLHVPLPVAQEAASLGEWEPSSQAVDGLQRTARDLQRQHTSPRLRTSRASVTSAGECGPAIVYVTFVTAAAEEERVAAFAQESLGDVLVRVVRRVPGAIGHKVTLSDGRVIGLPGKDGVSLVTRLAELGLGEGSEVQLCLNLKGVFNR